MDTERKIHARRTAGIAPLGVVKNPDREDVALICPLEKGRVLRRVMNA